MLTLASPVTDISGIGQKRAEQLAKLGIFTLNDFLLHYPRDYEDRTRFVSIAQAEPGQRVCISAVIGAVPKENKIRAGLTITKVGVFDDTSPLYLTFFNRLYLKTQLVLGKEYAFFGTVEIFNGVKTMQNPEFELLDKHAITGKILPIYRKTEGISRHIIMHGASAALECCQSQLEEIIPPHICQKFKLCSPFDAYSGIHCPKSFDDIASARRRLIFEEFFIFSCASAMLKQHISSQKGIGMKYYNPQDFFDILPFSPTNAQRSAVSDAFADMCSGKQMNRLIQGDVGSGKTLVAAACAWLTIKNGFQAAIMAPTALLAQQHYNTLSPIFDLFETKCALLTSNVSKKEKDGIKHTLSTGEIGVLFGTHALIEADVTFSQPALFVIDEQHRFGVSQRAMLTQKSANSHVLVMSATPIPRTLTLIMYGDLDVSIIDELPPGRQKILTYRIEEGLRSRLNGFISRQISENGQVYIVCPLIDDVDSQSEKNAATQYAQNLKSVFPNIKIGLLHGKLRPGEKSDIMDAFHRGEYNILVSTTVIEVGVNVPNATLMIIENAENFGLSQLHQLRGRVGRGQRQSYCILVQGVENELSKARLTAICKTTDGFLIAEEDLKLRGPGDFFGNRQHGMPEFKIADLAGDVRVLRSAQEEAAQVISSDFSLTLPQHSALKTRVDEIYVRMNNGTLN